MANCSPFVDPNATTSATTDYTAPALDASCEHPCDTAFHAVSDAEKAALATTLGSISTPIDGLDADGFTQASLAIFDGFVARIKTLLDEQYELKRIVGPDYPQHLVALTQAAIQASVTSSAEIGKLRIAERQTQTQALTNYANGSKLLQDRTTSARQASEMTLTGSLERSVKAIEGEKVAAETSLTKEQQIELVRNGYSERSAKNKQECVYDAQAGLYVRQKSAYDDQKGIDLYKATLDAYAVYAASVATDPTSVKVSAFEDNTEGAANGPDTIQKMIKKAVGETSDMFAAS